MAGRSPIAYQVFTAQAATGNSNTFFAGDFRNAVVTINTAGSANMTIKFQGALAAVGAASGSQAPDFTAAQSATNRWEYIQVVDYQSGAQIDGDTGIVLSGTDDNRIVEFNTNAVDYISVQVSARSAGSVTSTITLTDNE